MDTDIVAPEVDRRTFIGGSDAGAIIGFGATYRGRRQTALTVWEKKTGPASELDAGERLFLARRKRFEPQIIAMLREEFSAEITTTNVRYRDPNPGTDFLAAELDFEWIDPATGNTENGEIKTVHPLAFGDTSGWGEPGTDEVPAHYFSQVLHGLGVRPKASCCIVVAMIGFDNMEFYKVPREGYEETIASMREKCIRFWHDHIIARVPPAPQDWADMMALYSRMNGRAVECSEAMVKRLDQLRALREQIKALELAKEEITFEVADYIRDQWGIADPTTAPEKIDNAELRWNGQPVATWKKQRGAHLDQKGLRAAHPELVQRFTIEHWFRPIRFIKR